MLIMSIERLYVLTKAMMSRLIHFVGYVLSCKLVL